MLVLLELLPLHPSCHGQTTVSGQVRDLGVGDLGQDYKDGFRGRVVPKEGIGHVRCHMILWMTSEDYTSQM